MNAWWRRPSGPQQKQADPMMTHVLNLVGARGTLTKDQLLRHLRPGTPVTRVEWDGCMATVRRETGRGVVLRESRSQCGKYDGMMVAWEPGRERWEPLDYFRIVGDDVEVWQ